MAATISGSLPLLRLVPELLEAVANNFAPLHKPLDEAGKRKVYADEDYWGPLGTRATLGRYVATKGARITRNPFEEGTIAPDVSEVVQRFDLDPTAAAAAAAAAS